VAPHAADAHGGPLNDGPTEGSLREATEVRYHPRMPRATSIATRLLSSSLLLALLLRLART